MATALRVSSYFFCDAHLGAKFLGTVLQHSRDIANSVFYNFWLQTYYDIIADVICIIGNINISTMKKDISRRKLPFCI